MEYKVRVGKSKNGAILAAIMDNSGKVIKEIYSHYPELNEKANAFLLKKQIEILVWTDKIEITTDDK